MTNETDEREPKDFEDALALLEGIVKELEQGELSLESSLRRYETGVRLAKFCSGKLDEAEKRVALLQTDEEGELRRGADGAPRTVPLEIPE